VWRFGANGDETFFYPGTADGLLTLVAARRGRAAAEALGRRLARSGWEITEDLPTWAEVHGAPLDAAAPDASPARHPTRDTAPGRPRAESRAR
jgi:hypothetical protein